MSKPSLSSTPIDKPSTEVLKMRSLQWRGGPENYSRPTATEMHRPFKTGFLNMEVFRRSGLIDFNEFIEDWQS